MIRRTTPLILAALLLIAATPNQARAHAPMGGGAAAFGEAIIMLFIGGLVELAVPDVRAEFEADGASAALSWILPVTLAQLGELGEPRFMLRAGAEVHTESDDWNVRGVFTGRVDILFLPFADTFAGGVYLEGGYAVGDDSDAAVAGGGLIVDALGLANLLLMYRATLTEPELRHDVTLNLEVPIPLHLLYQDSVF